MGYLKNADTLIFIYPVWWFSMPAILKGYIDRVFSHGFAYEATADGIKGLLPGKEAVILNTTGGKKEDYEKYGFQDALKKTIEIGTFGLCGIEVILHKYFYAVPTASDEARKAMLKELIDLKV